MSSRYTPSKFRPYTLYDRLEVHNAQPFWAKGRSGVQFLVQSRNEDTITI